jgi:hypothetical protein
VYEEGDYPHRTFQLEVVVVAVCMVAMGGMSMTETARTLLCSRRSVGRWIRWVESVAQPQELSMLCARLDPDGLPPPSDAPSKATTVLALFERLTYLLSIRGLDLRGPTAGLTRFLLDRFERFGEVFYAIKQSPPLHADLAGLYL